MIDCEEGGRKFILKSEPVRRIATGIKLRRLLPRNFIGGAASTRAVR